MRKEGCALDRSLRWLIPALLAVLYLYGLDSHPLSNVDECRSGVIARSMLDDGEWLLPRTPDGHYTEKPIFYYGLCALASRVPGFGLGEGTLRGVSAVMALASLGVVWGLARIYGPARAGWIAVVALAANLLVLRSGRNATVDMTLSLFIAAGLTAYLAAREGKLGSWPASLLAGLCFGIATLSKGPVGMVLPLAICGSLELNDFRARGWGRSIPSAPLLVGFMLFAVIVAAWYVPAYLGGGRDFIDTSLLSENMYMPIGKPRGLGVGHFKSIWFYPMHQLLALVPVLPLLAPMMSDSLRRPASPGTRELATWFAAGFLLFLLAANKRTHYLLPLQPAVAAAIGLAAARQQGERASATLRWPAVAFAAALAIAGLWGLQLALYPASLLAEVNAATRLMLESGRVPLAVCALVSLSGSVLLLAASRQRPRVIVDATLCIAMLCVAMRVIGYEGVEGDLDRIRPFVRDAAARVPAPARPAVISPTGYALDFYWPGRLQRPDADPSRAEWLFIRTNPLRGLPGDFEVISLCDCADQEGDLALVHRRRRP